jgi:hypothetical protein
VAHCREWLAELLFADAADPLNGLGWNLTRLRRLLGSDAEIWALTAGTWVRALRIPGLSREFLERMRVGRLRRYQRMPDGSWVDGKLMECWPRSSSVDGLVLGLQVWDRTAITRRGRVLGRRETCMTKGTGLG